MICDDIISIFLFFLSYPNISNLFCFSVDTVALYVVQLERQFSSRRHSVSCLQFHVFVVALILFIIFVLCASMICCIFLARP